MRNVTKTCYKRNYSCNNKEKIMLWSNYFLKENRGTKAHLEVKAIHKEPGHTDSFPGPDTL